MDRFTAYSIAVDTYKSENAELAKYGQFASDCMKNNILISSTTFGFSIEEYFIKRSDLTIKDIFCIANNLSTALSLLHSYNIAHKEINKKTVMLFRDENKISAFILGLGHLPKTSSSKCRFRKMEDIGQMGQILKILLFYLRKSLLITETDTLRLD